MSRIFTKIIQLFVYYSCKIKAEIIFDTNFLRLILLVAARVGIINLHPARVITWYFNPSHPCSI